MLEVLHIWALIEILGICFLPLTIIIFHRLPDRGWAFSKTLGLVVVAFCVWLSLMLVPAFKFNHYLLWNVVAFLLPTNLVGFWWVRRELVMLFRRAFPYLLMIEILFLGMTFLLAWLYLHDPGIRTSEHLMNEGILAALLRSERFPPQDMWFAGQPLDVYYYAHFILALLAKFSGQSASLAINTGACVLAGLVAINLSGIVGNLVAWTRAEGKNAGTTSSTTQRSSTEMLTGSISFALLGMGMGTMMGNLAAALQWWRNRDTGLRFDWLIPSQLIDSVTTEFPAFSFLLSGARTHVLSLAFTLLALAMAFNIFLGKDERGLRVFGRWGQLVLTLLCGALIVGSLGVLNGWDLPTYAGLTLITLILQQWLAHKARLSFAFIGNIVLTVGLFFGLAFLLFLPFYPGFTLPFTEIGLVVSTMRTPIRREMLVSGIFAFTFISLLLASTLQRPLATITSRAPAPAPVPFPYRGSTVILHQSWHPPAQRKKNQFSYFKHILIFCLLWLFLTLPLFVPTYTTALMAGGTALVGFLLMLVHRGDRAHAFTLLSGLVACVLIASCEVLFFKDALLPDAPRHTTMLHFYFQAWILFAVAAGAGSFLTMRYCFARGNGHPLPRFLRGLLGCLWTGTLIAVCAIGAIYPALAPQSRYSMVDQRTQQVILNRQENLDSMAYLQTAPQHRGDAEALRWLNTNVQGTPIIIEAIGNEPDRLYGRVSGFTGLPTLVGYAGHELQWRYHWLHASIERIDSFNQRIADVTLIYTGTDPQNVLATLKKYQARYIYVGELEREHYRGTDLQRFRTFMQVVYEQDGVAIYQVHP